MGRCCLEIENIPLFLPAKGEMTFWELGEVPAELVGSIR